MGLVSDTKKLALATPKVPRQLREWDSNGSPLSGDGPGVGVGVRGWDVNCQPASGYPPSLGMTGVVQRSPFAGMTGEGRGVWWGCLAAMVRAVGSRLRGNDGGEAAGMTGWAGLAGV